jgi:hypothetical protein
MAIFARGVAREDRRGARLLDRSLRRLALTEVARACYERSARIVSRPARDGARRGDAAARRNLCDLAARKTRAFPLLAEAHQRIA